jgi:hypothetical protein
MRYSISMQFASAQHYIRFVDALRDYRFNTLNNMLIAYDLKLKTVLPVPFKKKKSIKRQMCVSFRYHFHVKCFMSDMSKSQIGLILFSNIWYRACSVSESRTLIIYVMDN